MRMLVQRHRLLQHGENDSQLERTQNLNQQQPEVKGKRQKT